MDIVTLLKERILILDGAMGTMIQRYTLEEEDFRGSVFQDRKGSLKGNNDLLNLTRPDIIFDIHKAYLEAGADIIETNTFSGTTIAQADYQLEDAVYQINLVGAQIAKKAALSFSDRPRFVAGSIGPTNRTASISPDVNNPGYRAVTFSDLSIAYAEQIRALMDGEVDILLIETVFDTLNAKAALYAAEQVFNERAITLPIMVSGTITDLSGRTLSGQTPEAFLISLEHIPLLSIGLNCALGSELMEPYLKTLSDRAPYAVSAHPNAGLPNAFGQYDETADLMRDKIKSFFEKGLVNIVGGCCGTTPEHIKAIATLAQQYKPRTWTP
ncbi:MAG: homocysteine S-methyltransferase family protein [Flavobacteriales bacterium]|jgi:5-methyltetrahydrofolate--homocysteine methyltransferase